MLKCVLIAIAMLASPGAVLAQAWPAKPIRIVVPFPPGGGTDIGTRILAQKLQEAFGQAVVIENKPGRPASSAPSSLRNRHPTATPS